MKKEVLGQPVWLWALGAVIVVGGYLYFKHQQGSTAPSSGSGGQQKSTSNITETIKDWQGPPTPPAPPKPPKKKKGGG